MWCDDAQAPQILVVEVTNHMIQRMHQLKN